MERECIKNNVGNYYIKVYKENKLVRQVDLENIREDKIVITGNRKYLILDNAFIKEEDFNALSHGDRYEILVNYNMSNIRNPEQYCKEYIVDDAKLKTLTISTKAGEYTKYIVVFEIPDFNL